MWIFDSVGRPAGSQRSPDICNNAPKVCGVAVLPLGSVATAALFLFALEALH